MDVGQDPGNCLPCTNMEPFRLLLAAALLLFLSILSQAQELNPLSQSEEEADYRKDKLDGTLQEWTKAESKAFLKECEQQVQGKVGDPKSFCSCAQLIVARNLNYSRFMDRTAYQRGRALGYLTHGSCK